MASGELGSTAAGLVVGAAMGLSAGAPPDTKRCGAEDGCAAGEIDCSTAADAGAVTAPRRTPVVVLEDETPINATAVAAAIISFTAANLTPGRTQT